MPGSLWGGRQQSPWLLIPVWTVTPKASALSQGAMAGACFGREHCFIWEPGLPIRELQSLLVRASTVQGKQLEDFEDANIWE